MRENNQRGRILLTSQGLNTNIGYQLIKNQLQKDDLSRKTIFLCVEPYYSIEKQVINACKALGFSENHIRLSTDLKPEKETEYADYIYVTEGNTFRILKNLQEKRLMQLIRNAVLTGTCYIGASAGAVLAGKDIRCAELVDVNDVGIRDFTAFGFLDGAICPHMTNKQLRMFLNNEETGLMKSYKKIYAIANGKILIL